MNRGHSEQGHMVELESRKGSPIWQKARGKRMGENLPPCEGKRREWERKAEDEVQSKGLLWGMGLTGEVCVWIRLQPGRPGLWLQTGKDSPSEVGLLPSDDGFGSVVWGPVSLKG